MPFPLFCLLALLASPGSCALEEDLPAPLFRWAAGGSAEGETAPSFVPFRDGLALKFERSRGTFLSLGQGEGGSLRFRGALTLAAVVQLDTEAPGKVSLISKWHLVRGGRSYELGVTGSGQLFFTVSASGSWPEKALELMSTRPLERGVPSAVLAVFDPGRRMALYVNGVPSGERTDRVPDRLFDSLTPLWLGNRFGSEKACALDGRIAEVCFFDEALDAAAAAAWAGERRLRQPPAPEFPVLDPPYDLDRIADRTRAWYRRLEAPGEPYGAYRLRPWLQPDLYASADIAWIRWMMNDLDLTDEQRGQWIRFIQDQQDPEDGSYRHITGHCATHAFCHATGALNMLGGKQRHEPRILAPYRETERVPGWLDAIDWHGQWGASHDIWGAGLPLVCTPGTQVSWKEAVFAWLDAEADPKTGFWRKGVKARSPLEYLGGAFHIWPLYAAVERPIPFPERVIDSVLALQSGNGSFGGGFDYGNMDGVWVLQYLGSRLEWRRDAVKAALEKNLHGLMDLHNRNPGRFFSSAHSTESRIATLAMLQAALPELLPSKKAWRNPWHRRELFVVRIE